MSEESGAEREQLVLLIDFENLVYGLREQHGEERLLEALDIESLFRFAEEHGSVAVARAYADWRRRELNQFQLDLFRSGADLVHVLGRIHGDVRRNAADVRIAVDATEMLFTLPNVSTYVIVSGDSDFIDLLKVLRRHGKTIIGVAPRNAASRDFAALCDRFVMYSVLHPMEEEHGVRDPQREEGLEEVREVLGDLLERHKESGIKGAQLKPAIRREIPTFDETAYGFSSFRAFLQSMPDLVALGTDRNSLDILAFPRGTEIPDHTPMPNEPELSGSAEQRRLVRIAGLAQYRFMPNRERRHGLLGHLFAALGQPDGFVWQEVRDRLIDDKPLGINLTSTMLTKIFYMFFQGRAFEIEDSSAPFAERHFKLKDELATEERFISFHEVTALYKLGTKLGRCPTDREAVSLLGIEEPQVGEIPELLRHTKELLQSEFGPMGAPAAQVTARPAAPHARDAAREDEGGAGA